MSGLVIVLGAQREAKKMVALAVTAAPGRGPVQAEFCNDQITMQYQGFNPARDFAASADYVCISLGWPYQLHAQSDRPTRLDAGDIISQFASCRSLLVEQIFGQYVIVIFCRKSAQLFVLRDVFGSLPLHWAPVANGCIHASDIRQIASAQALPMTIVLSALREYQQTLRLPADSDLYSGIHLHRAGEFSVSTASGLRLLRAVPGPRDLFPGFSSAPQPFDVQTQLIDAVRVSVEMCHLGSKTAFSLSGGMDSALLLLCASQIAASPISVSCTFPKLKCDESKKISVIVKAAGSYNEQIVFIEPPFFSQWQERLFLATDYVPFPANQIGLHMAQAAARLGCAQLIDGNGGDELFDWGLLDLAQVAQSRQDFKNLLLGLCSNKNGQRILALRHLGKRLLRRQPLVPINDPLELSSKLLSASTQSAFYLAAEQIASSVGIELYNPLRDLRLLRLFAPWLPCGSYRDGCRRGVQADAIYKLSASCIKLVRDQKVNFNEFAFVPFDAIDAEGLPDLGPGKLPDFAGLMPKFLKHKVEKEGVLYK